VIHRIDRVFRSLKDMTKVVSALAERGVFLWIVESGIRTDTPFGRMLVEMLVWVAQMESYEIDISSNTAVAHQYRTKGIALGAIPMFLRRGREEKCKPTGKRFCVQDTLTAEEKEQFVVEWIQAVSAAVAEYGYPKGIAGITRRLSIAAYNRIGFPIPYQRRSDVTDTHHLTTRTLLDELKRMDVEEVGPEFKARRKRRAELRKDVKAYLSRGGRMESPIWKWILDQNLAKKSWQRCVEWAKYLHDSPAEVRAKLGLHSPRILENLSMILRE
jgi:hypothetical protein